MKLYVGDKTLHTIYAVGLTLCIWIVAVWVGWHWGGLARFAVLLACPVAWLMSEDLARLTREIVSEWMERVLNGDGSREDWVGAQRALDQRLEAYDTGDRPSSPPAALCSAVVEVSVTLTLWEAL